MEVVRDLRRLAKPELSLGSDDAAATEFCGREGRGGR